MTKDERLKMYQEALEKIADPNRNRWHTPADKVTALQNIARAVLDGVDSESNLYPRI